MNSLKEIGLTDYETKAYIAILENGKLNAREIAANSKIPPTSVYPNVKNLVKKGLVQEVKGEISFYEAIPPKKAWDFFLKNKINELEESTKSAVKNLEQIHNKKSFAPSKNPILLSLGIVASSAISTEWMANAKNFVNIMGWGFHKPKNKHKILGKLRNAALRGVDVKLLITDDTNLDEKTINLYKKKNFQIRKAPIRDFSLVICDEKVCKITLKNKQLPDRMNISVEDPSLAKAMNEYFMKKWEEAS